MKNKDNSCFRGAVGDYIINDVKRMVRIILKPIIKIVKYYKIKSDIKKKQTHYDIVIKDIKNSGKTKIDFAAYVIFDSTYGIDGVFQLMRKDEKHWNPKLVVIPDISRGKQHTEQTYNKTREYFSKRYGERYILDGWNYQTGEYFDYIDRFDIVYFANPYDSMVHKFHKIEYAASKKVLPIYVSYGYDVGKYTTLDRLKNKELNIVWKYFADTTYSYEDNKKYQINKGRNVILAGYSKMDKLPKCLVKTKARKKILITPHHTVCAKILPLSNFLKFNELILKLPSLFPEIDFVFRPHPLLFTTLANNKIWSEDKISEYIDKLKYSGIEYSTGGDYLDLFAECDAIINDCGSFTVEWLYTGKPGCFVYNEKLKKKHLTKLMKKAISSYSIAKTEKDIIDFIQNISKMDIEHEYKMESWVRENIALNYPEVSRFLLNEINILEKRNEEA